MALDSSWVLSFFGTLTALGQLLIVLLIIGVLTKSRFFSSQRKKFIYAALLVSLVATLGSLSFSEIFGLVPCRLCWFQRIMMYPIAIISTSLVLFKKTEVFKFCTIPLAVIGALISIYHYCVQFARPILSCGTEDCSVKLVALFGYITIPLMALTAFVLIIIFSALYKKERF